ncbi:MAG: DNA polymerase III subunit gamma/tau [Subdoligranulum sp.]|nr:DNA polymerase III subunit gamma/tau [Subdoligranulum sp.]
MYRALYRKWRPKNFEDVIGQADIVTALENQLLHGRVGHAYLFTGTRGTGKTTCAKIFAKAVNCPERDGAEPCGKCSVCTGIDDGGITDVVEIDAASNNGVNDIRDLREESVYAPSVCTYKVYIIDEVHMLSREAFNALLKIMEEPPAHVIFILATTEVHKVPATILSRCQRYDFMRIAPDDIARRLLYVAGQESIALAPEAAQLIARLADGAMRDALSILDTCAGVTSEVDEALVRRMAGVTDRGYLFELSQAVAGKDAEKALCLVAELRERSIDLKRLCDEMILHYRNLMIAGMPGGARLLSGVSAEEEQRYAETASGISRRDAIRAIKTLCGALDQMGKGTDVRIELELALFRLCEEEPEAVPMAFAPGAPAAARTMGAAGAGAAQPFAAGGAPQPFTAAGAAPQPFAAAPGQAAPSYTAAPGQTAPSYPAAPGQAAPPRTAASTEYAVMPGETAPAVSAAPAQAGAAAPLSPAAPAQTGETAISSPSAQGAAHAPSGSAAPAQGDSRAQAAPAQTAQPAAPAAGQTPPQPFAAWDAVVQAMAARDNLLYANLKETKAYCDGRRVLIDGGDLFLEFMRKNDYSKELIKQAIAEVTGTRYAIGPYRQKDSKPAEVQSAEETLNQLAQQGVEVIYEDEEKNKKES